MTVAVKKWGNSLALRIPRDISRTLHIEDNSELELEVEEGVLILKPKNSLLEKLVSKITDDNLHSEIQTGEVVGHEEW